MQSVPLHAARRISDVLAIFIFYIIPIRRKITLQNLRYAFPDLEDRQIKSFAFQSYQNLTRVIIELLWFPRFTDDVLARTIRIQNRDVITEALKRGKGAIFLSGHFGNWELLAFGVARMMRTPYMVIVHPQQNELVAKMINDLRSRFGNRMVDMHMGVREIIKTLRARGIVAMLTDQSGPSKSPFINFFGRPAATYEGPAALALKLEVPVVFGIGVRRDDGNYDVHFNEINTNDLKGATEENITELTRRHVAYLEECIRCYPGQWLWQHKRWKHQAAASRLHSPSTEGS